MRHGICFVVRSSCESELSNPFMKSRIHAGVFPRIRAWMRPHIAAVVGPRVLVQVCLLAPSRAGLRISALVYLLLTTAAFGDHASAAKPNLERISISTRSDGEGYVIRFHLDAPVAAYAEPRFTRMDEVEMVLFNTGLSDSYRRDAPGGVVEGYTEELSGGHLIIRFVVDPSKPMAIAAYRDRDSNDVLLGFTYSAGAIARSDDVAWETPNAGAEDPESLGSPESVPVRRVSTTPTTPEASQWLLDTVVIDAGHGGRDPGAVEHGIREKDVTLAVARKLGSYLKEQLGVNVVYTRTDDRFIELSDRGKIANAHGGKLFISIHVNAARNAAASGAETYFLGMHKSEAARATMERENSVVMLESSQEHYENMTEEALIRMELTQSAYMRKSQELAGLIQEQFETRVQRRNRGVKQAGFYVLWGASMPAVLVELGFVTNRAEARFLNSEQGQDYLASAIYRAVRAYKETYEKGLSRVAADPG